MSLEEKALDAHQNHRSPNKSQNDDSTINSSTLYDGANSSVLGFVQNDHSPGKLGATQKMTAIELTDKSTDRSSSASSHFGKYER